jgi:hypothetical protein
MPAAYYHGAVGLQEAKTLSMGDIASDIDNRGSAACGPFDIFGELRGPFAVPAVFGAVDEYLLKRMGISYKAT